MFVVLTPEERKFAYLRGKERQDIAERTRAHSIKKNAHKSDLEIHVLGSCGEVATNKIVGGWLTPNNEYSGDNGVDITKNEFLLDVKTRSKYREYALFPNYSRSTLATHYVSVTQYSDTVYDVHGIITSEKVDEVKEWLDFLPRPCYGVHIKHFTPIDQVSFNRELQRELF